MRFESGHGKALSPTERRLCSQQVGGKGLKSNPFRFVTYT